MTPEQRNARAIAAQALMNDPTLKDALDSLEADIIAEWSKDQPWGAPQAAAKREALYVELQMLRKARQRLASFAGQIRE